MKKTYNNNINDNANLKIISSIWQLAIGRIFNQWKVNHNTKELRGEETAYCLLPTAYFKNLITIAIFLVFTLFLLETTVNAQTPLKKEVEVVKPYEPVVSDANKINVLPKISDSVVIKPNIQYNITPIMVNTEYQVSAINAAKMMNMPISKLYKNYIKLGFGNYTSPLAELYVNSSRSKKHTAGIFLKHQSSAGKLKLENGDKVFAGYSETSGELFGRKFFKNSYLYANGGARGNTVYDYGYYPKLDTALEKGDIRQNYFLANANAGIRSTNSDSTKLNYDIGLKYNFFQDRVKHGENNINIAAQLRQLFLTDKLFGINVNYNLLKRNEKLDSTGYANSLLVLDPWVGMSSPDYRLKGGLKFCFQTQNNTLKISFIPYGEFQFAAVKDVLIPFVGLNGQVNTHSYQDIAFENPYIHPGLLVKNSVTRDIYGGLKGSLGAKASYILKVDFAKLKDQYFFVNDSLSTLRNTFTVVYDNGDKFNGYAEVNYDYSEHLSFAAKANYYKYTLEHQAYAWHKPDFDFTFSTIYNLRNKILINFDVLAVGNRYAKEYSVNQKTKSLAGVVDFNLGVEYRYTKILSAWIRLYNFTAAKYYEWNQYPTQQFNVMVGFTYSL
jgi:hypothetical protein